MIRMEKRLGGGGRSRDQQERSHLSFVTYLSLRNGYILPAPWEPLPWGDSCQFKNDSKTALVFLVLPERMTQTDPLISAKPVSRLPLGHLPWKPAMEAPRREATFAGSAPGTRPSAIRLGNHQSARGTGGTGPSLPHSLLHLDNSQC